MSETSGGHAPPTSYTASDLIEEFSKEYLHEIFRNHFPSYIDGLKVVYRRWIFSQFVGKLTETVTKSSRAVAELSAHHPYNETSMYDVIMRMAQPWVTYPCMARSPSNNGSYSGNDAGSSRYTEVGMSEYTREMFLKGIDVAALPKVEGPYMDLEPVYYVPALPTALIIDNLTIGFAVGCLTARLEFSNVCDLVCDYVQHRIDAPHKPWDYHRLAEKFLPDFTTPCIITNADALVEAYRYGNFNHPIELDGQVIVSRDRILVQSLPHGLSFRNIIDTFEEHLRKFPNGDIRKMMKDYNFTRSKKMLGDFSIYPKQGVNALALWRLVAMAIRFYGRFHPNPNYAMLDMKTVAPVAYPNVIAGWYKQRVMILSATKRRRLQILQRQRQIQQAQIVVAKSPDRCLEIIRESDTEALVIETFASEFGLTPFQSKALLDMDIRALLKTSTVKLHETLEKTVQAIEALTASFNDVGEDIIRTAQHFKRKYGSGRRSHIPSYIGYIAFSHGIVLFEDSEDFGNIMEAFPKEPATVYMFDSPYRIGINEDGKFLKSSMHKYMWGDIWSVPTPDGLNGTYTVSLKDGGLSYSYGVKPTRRDPNVMYVTKDVVTLSRHGKIKHEPITNYSKRLNCLQSKGAMTNVVMVISDRQEPFYVAQFNNSDPNILTIQLIKPGQAHYVTNPVGQQYLFYSRTGEDWYITPPADCINRVAARAIRIISAADMLPEGAVSIRHDLLSRTRRNANVVLID